MIDMIRREPAMTAAVVQAVLALVVAFGVPLSDEQVGSILALSAALLGMAVRAKVTPTRKV